MEKYCNTLDINYIDKETKKNKNFIKEVLKEVKISDIPKEKKHIYYMINSYFYPSKIESHKSWLNIYYLCDYFSKYNLLDEDIKKLFFTIYNRISLKGLKPDLSNISVKYLEELFKIVDNVYFTNLLDKFLKDEKSVLKFELTTKKSSNVAGLCTKKECTYTISITEDLHIDYFNEYISVQTANGIKCSNPLMCVISTFLHELVHVIIFAFCFYKNTSYHPPIFEKITKSLFGHTDYKHRLGMGDSYKIGVTKNDLQGRRYITFSTYVVDYLEGVKYTKMSKYLVEITKINLDNIDGIVIKGDSILYQKGDKIRVPFYMIDKKLNDLI